MDDDQNDDGDAMRTPTDRPSRPRRSPAEIYLDRWESHLRHLAQQGWPPKPEDPR